MKTNTVRNMLQNHLRLTEQFIVSSGGSCISQQAVWRRVLEGFLQLSVYIEASQNFIFYFLRNMAAKKFKNYRHIYCTLSTD